MKHSSLLIKSALITLLLTQTACGLLIGNIKPVDEKSDAYGVADLSKETPGWTKLDAAVRDSEDTSSDISDVAYQSQKTSSIISLNSACRPNTEKNPKTLKEFTNLLLLGISDVSLREEKDLTLQDSPALQTTIRGKLNGEEMMLQTVVLRRRSCVYDLMYVARPEYFAENEPTFAHFIASLRVKE